MAKGDSSDIFMTFKTMDNGYLVGESTSDLLSPLGSKSKLLTNFNPGYIFEVTKFDFGVGVEQKAVEDFEYPPWLRHLAKKGNVPIEKQGRPKTDRSTNRGKSDDSPVSVQPISFSRTMDKGSRDLLHHTIKRTFFERAALVKRKSAGGVSAGEPYLRMDFKGVILIEASWSDDEPIEETYTFHARAITMRYCPQLPDGTLGAEVPGFWSMDPNEHLEKL
jgi:type VI protein secretion system component Hcp